MDCQTKPDSEDANGHIEDLKDRGVKEASLTAVHSHHWMTPAGPHLPCSAELPSQVPQPLLNRSHDPPSFHSLVYVLMDVQRGQPSLGFEYLRLFMYLMGSGTDDF